MKQIILIAALGVAIAGCTAQQQQDAKAVAAAGLDAVCSNLSTADIYFKSQIAPRNINATAQATEKAAVATIQSYCDNRPVTDAAGALKVAASALAKIAALAQ
ncbi:MAG: hypothetical protein ABIO35_08335 [Nitrobacter sp.]